MLQIDGSHHRWLEERGPRLPLLLTVDDTAECVTCEMFCHGDTAGSYFLLLEPAVMRR